MAVRPNESKRSAAFRRDVRRVVRRCLRRTPYRPINDFAALLQGLLLNRMPIRAKTPLASLDAEEALRRRFRHVL